MSSKFNPARPAGKKPPICKGVRPPSKDMTPGETFPIIAGLPLRISISWSEISPQRPWSIKRTFSVMPDSPVTWTISDFRDENTVMSFNFFYSNANGVYGFGGSIIVDGILEDTISFVANIYDGGQPFFLPLQKMPNTHPQQPTPAVAMVAIAI